MENGTRKCLLDYDKQKRILHPVIELERNGFLEVYAQDEEFSKCSLTSIGKELIPYIEPPETVF
jgi:hypothetical protein